MTESTCSALKRTLRCTANLIEDLLREGYIYVLTSRFQSDPLERRYSQYRQMSGGRFLVGLREVNTSEKIIKMKSLLKEDILFWEKDIDIHIEQNESVKVENLIEIIKERSLDMESIRLSPDSREVAVYISGYVVKKFHMNFTRCDNCDMVEKTLDKHSDDYAYLSTVNRGGLIFPSTSLLDYVCDSFAAIEYFSDIVVSSGLPVRKATEILLTKLNLSGDFLCSNHHEKGLVFIHRIITNIYLNNERKELTDKAKKDEVKRFKNAKRSKINDV